MDGIQDSKSLEFQRTELLQQILELEKASNPIEEPNVYQKLRLQYDALMDEIYILKKGPLPDPLSYFPPEIWLECLSTLIEENPDELFNLILVSSKWCNDITATPILWTKLSVNDGIDTSLKLHVSRILSGGLPLTVIISLPLQDSNVISLQLLPEKDRIREIVFDVGERYVTATDFHGYAIPILGSFGNLPSLEIIQSKNPGCISLPLFNWTQFAPRLCKSPGWCVVHAFELGDCNTSVIYSMESHMSFADACSWITQLPKLEILKLIDQTMLTFPENMDSEARKSIFSQSRIRKLDCKLIIPLGGPSFPSLLHLTSLRLSLSWVSLQAFFSDIPHLPSLDDLYLSIEEIHGVTFKTPSLIPDFGGVRAFHLQVREDPSSDGGTSGTSATITFFATAVLAMTGIQDLHLELVPITPLRPILVSMESLTRLIRVRCSGRYYVEAGPIVELPLVEEMTISDVGFLSFTRTPNLRNLVVTDFVTKGSFTTNGKYNLQNLTLPGESGHMVSIMDISNVQILHWTGNELHTNVVGLTFTFTSLRELKFDAGFMSAPCNFLARLILEPHLCPQLESLSFALFPHLRLLTRMLLRRNLSPLGVTPIKTLKLPGYPPPLYLSTIVRLLGQRFVDPNEAGGPGFADYALYYDPSILGCHYCFGSGWYCPSKFTDYGTENSYVDEWEPEDPSLLNSEQKGDHSSSGNDTAPGSYQESDEEWIVHWWKNWKEDILAFRKWSVRYGRIAYCDRHDPANLVTITANTLHESSFKWWSTTMEQTV